MAYALTQDDIDRFGIPNAKAGDIANPADRALLSLPPEAEAPVSAAEPIVGNQQTLMGLLETPIPQDPFENLSRGQRTMIGFAALKDAGLALQGKDGGAVQGVISDITNRADMERKRQMQLGNLQQERKRQAALDAFLTNGVAGGVAGAMSGQPASAKGVEAQIAALQSQVGAYAQMDQLDLYAQRMKELLGQRDRLEEAEVTEVEKSKGITGQLSQAKEAVATAKSALAAATGLSGDELKKQLDAGAIDPRSFAFTRQSFVPDSKDFKDFQAAASKLGAMMTFSNLSEILDRGVVLGTLSDADFAIIGNLTGVIDPINMPQQTAQTIFQAYNNLNKTIEAIEAENASGDPFDALTKKYQ
jgi:hypothetical protein